MCACALAVSLALSLAPPAPMTDKTRKQPPTAAQIAALVRQLGDDRFERREAASRALAAAGEPALDALRKAASSKDPEVRRRAASVCGTIVQKVHARELGKLKGKWVVCGEEYAGEKRLARAAEHWARFEASPTGPVFHSSHYGANWAVKLIDARNGSGKVDLLCGTETFQCLYRVEGERLVLAWPAGYLYNGERRGACDRPRVLKTRAKDTFYVLIFERPKPSPEPPARAAAPAPPRIVPPPPGTVPAPPPPAVPFTP